MINKVSMITDDMKNDIVQLYNLGHGTMELAKKFNVSNRGMIAKVLTDAGIKLRKKSPVSKYDVNFFKEYNADSCYWAGFIAADGGIRYSRDSVDIKLAKKDLDHVVKFSKAIKYNGTVGLCEKTCSISVSGKWFVEDLGNNFGVFPRKTYTIEISNKIPKELLHHFIRGYFDGDGCVTITSCPTISFTSGSQKLLYQLIDIFHDDLEVRLKTKTKKPQLKESTQAISYSGRNAKKILDWIYDDSNATIRMNRKYDRYVDYFSYIKD